ncbi:MAG: 50S ribosomal protein L22 [Planctomycetes bacterium]|nr:50S ribosomal protein L22 [Planctomycetota bacterium]
MSYRAIHRHAHIAARKARLVASMIRGRKIDDALTALEFSKLRGAWYFKAVLKSAIANAEEQDADVHTLFVTEIRVDEGPRTKRWRPKDRGRAHPFCKYSSHLYVTVDERT